ncbi:MAG TPA: hypothetical protein VKB35_03785 [Ktedonobacteraceae bacterium]|nr:hypothetical protein [Ktedonobacteraceae bacterium]
MISKKKGKPGMPTPRNHPTLYEGTCSLTLDGVDLRASFVRLRVYTGGHWEWVNYPTRYSRYFEARRTESDWQAHSPKLVLTKSGAAIHFPQAKKQWQSGKAVRGERSNQQLWGHIRRMNEDAAHQVARKIAEVCARYPGRILLFERLRKIRPKGGSKSRRMNRRQANQLRGKINQYARDKAYEHSIVTVEVNRL